MWNKIKYGMQAALITIIFGIFLPTLHTIQVSTIDIITLYFAALAAIAALKGVE